MVEVVDGVESGSGLMSVVVEAVDSDVDEVDDSDVDETVDSDVDEDESSR